MTALSELEITTAEVSVKIPQGQDSACPKCGRLTHRGFFSTDGSVHFGCSQGHDDAAWAVAPKTLKMPEADLVGLILAWNMGNVTDALKIVREGSWRGVATA